MGEGELGQYYLVAMNAVEASGQMWAYRIEQEVHSSDSGYTCNVASYFKKRVNGTTEG